MTTCRIAQLFVLIVVGLVPAFAFANMRAPYEVGGGMADTRFVPAADTLVLTHETLRIDLPTLVDEDDVRGDVQVSAKYTFENPGDALELDLVFYATDIKTPAVTVNGVQLAAPVVEDMNDEQVSEFWQAHRAALGMTADAHERLKYQKWRRPRLQVAKFRVKLPQGRNTIAFAYAQDPMMAESSPRYGQPRIEDMTSGMDYLLYPAEAWKRSDDFELDVEIVARDWLDEGWFFDDWYEVNLVGPKGFARERGSNRTTYRATFNSFPSSILSVRTVLGNER